MTVGGGALSRYAGNAAAGRSPGPASKHVIGLARRFFGLARYRRRRLDFSLQVRAPPTKVEIIINLRPQKAVVSANACFVVLRS